MVLNCQRHTPAVLHWEIDPVPNIQETRWVPAPVWTVAEIFPLTGIRSPDIPAQSMSLHRLRYFGLYVKHFIQSLEKLIVAKPLNEYSTLIWKRKVYCRVYNCPQLIVITNTAAIL